MQMCVIMEMMMMLIIIIIIVVVIVNKKNNNNGNRIQLRCEQLCKLICLFIGLQIERTVLVEENKPILPQIQQGAFHHTNRFIIRKSLGLPLMIPHYPDEFPVYFFLSFFSVSHIFILECMLHSSLDP